MLLKREKIVFQAYMLDQCYQVIDMLSNFCFTQQEDNSITKHVTQQMQEEEITNF